MSTATATPPYSEADIRSAGSIQLRVIGRAMLREGCVDLDVLEAWGGNRQQPSSFISSAGSTALRAILLGERPDEVGAVLTPSKPSPAADDSDDDDDSANDDDDSADDEPMDEPEEGGDMGLPSFGDDDSADDDGEPMDEPEPKAAPAPVPPAPAPAPASDDKPSPAVMDAANRIAEGLLKLKDLGVVGDSIKNAILPMSGVLVESLMDAEKAKAGAAPDLAGRVATVERLANATSLEVREDRDSIGKLSEGLLDLQHRLSWCEGGINSLSDRIKGLEETPKGGAIDPDALTETILSALRSIIPPVPTVATPTAPSTDGATGHAAALELLADPETPRNLRILAKFATPGAASRPVKFTGEPGAAKTWAARRFAALFDPVAVFDVSCHAGTTSREFLGACLPGTRGGFEVVYGRVSRAFRTAAGGAPTLLVLDELNRLPLELSSVFCGALNRQVRPVAIGGAEPQLMECYVLDSGIPDGFGGTEEYAAPCHLLSIVSTQNEGPGYNVNSEDRAEKQRWLHVRCPFDPTETKRIVKGVLASRFPTAESPRITGMAEKLTQFLIMGREAAMKNRKLESAPTLRVIVESIALSSAPTDIAVNLRELSLGWFCGLSRVNGDIEPEHVTTLDGILTGCDLKHGARTW